MSAFEKLHDRAVAFFDGEHDRNNVVNLIRGHVPNKPDAGLS